MVIDRHTNPFMQAEWHYPFVKPLQDDPHVKSRFPFHTSPFFNVTDATKLCKAIIAEVQDTLALGRTVINDSPCFKQSSIALPP